jgi:hypothetical protein
MYYLVDAVSPWSMGHIIAVILRCKTFTMIRPSFEVSMLFVCCATVQMIRYQPVTVDIRVHVWVSSYGFCDGQSDTETGFSPSFLVFPVDIIHHGSPCSYITWGLEQ